MCLDVYLRKVHGKVFRFVREVRLRMCPAFADVPGYFIIGFIWIIIHVIMLLIVGKIIKAPFFFTAVGSQANVGGAASAPIVASAFSPALAPVGVLLAVLGYGVGTFGALLCGNIMQIISSGVL